MELVRELDRDKLFIMVNMRSYFSDEDMENFTESVSLHDFKVLLLENHMSPKLTNTKRYVIDIDLCEFQLVFSPDLGYNIIAPFPYMAIFQQFVVLFLKC